MSDWQPMETAPKDGTPVLGTDSYRAAVFSHSSYSEPEFVYQRKPLGPLSGSVPDLDKPKVPNPFYPKTTYFWAQDGCIPLVDDADILDEDGEGPFRFEPTHWMPRPDPPEDDDQDPGSAG